MTRDLSPTRTLAQATLPRLDAHFADMLGCEAHGLRQPGVAVVACAQRADQDRRGLHYPVLGVGPENSSAIVLSCLPELHDGLTQAVEALSVGPRAFDMAWLAALQQALAHQSGLTWLDRLIFYADAGSFRPYGVDPSVKFERWEPGARPDSALSRAFDGPCFVVRDHGGQIAAWAGLTRTSALAWEIESVTAPAYRGRGLATSLTAHATAELIDRGLLALWVADQHNAPSHRLVERLGFLPYGRQVAAQHGQPTF